MKKITLLFIACAMLSLTVAKAQVQANIYASELKASSVATDGDVEITYTLNADASAVTVNVENNEPISIPEGTNNWLKGVHTVTINLANPPAQEESLLWSVKADGVAAKTNTTGAPVKFTSDDNPLIQVCSPRGGVAVDKNFDSPFFGRVYMTESMGGVDNGKYDTTRQTYDGIYILNAALEDITGQEANSYAGGLNLILRTPAYVDLSPYFVSVAPDGKVLVPVNYYLTATPDSLNLWIMDAEKPAENFVPAFGGKNRTPHPIRSHIIGDDLFVFEQTNEDAPLAYRIVKYANFSAPHTGAITQTLYSGATTTSKIYPATRSNANFIPDGRGGWWIAQGLATSGAAATESSDKSSLYHIDANGTFDYESYVLGIGNIIRGAVAYNKEKELIAVGVGNTIKFFDVKWTTNVPSLTAATPAIFTTSLSSTYTIDFLEFDAANNLYMGSSSTEKVYVYAMPTTALNNTFTTIAPASQALVSAEPNNTKAVTLGSISVVCLGNDITITSGSAIQSVKLYDLQGRTIISVQGIAAGTYSLTAPSKGIYIVETVTGDACGVQKIVIR